MIVYNLQSRPAVVRLGESVAGKHTAILNGASLSAALRNPLWGDSGIGVAAADGTIDLAPYGLAFLYSET